MKVSEVMTADVVSVKADATVREIATLMRKHRFAGIPVVDDGNRVIGIVGEGDLLPKEVRLPFSSVKVPSLFKKVVSRGNIDLEKLYRKSGDVTAADVMEDDVITVDAGADVGEAAWRMAHYKVKRLPVVKGGRLVGIITRGNMIELLAAIGGEEE